MFKKIILVPIISSLSLLIFSAYYFNLVGSKTPVEKSHPESKEVSHPTKITPIQISYTEAGKHTGEYATVRTPVKYQFNNGKYLIFSSRVNPHHTYMVQDVNQRDGFFTVRILSKDLDKFPEDFGQQILNKEIEVTGVVTWYQSDPHIIVESPEQIKIL